MKSSQIKKVLSVIAIPLSLLVVYLTVIIFWKALGLPPQAELIEIIKKFFDDYGLIVVFVGAFI